MKYFLFLILLTGIISCAQTSQKNRTIASQTTTNKIESKLLNDFAIKVVSGGYFTHPQSQGEKLPDGSVFGARDLKRYFDTLINGDDTRPSDSNYLNFINALLAEAENSLEKPLYFPENITVVVRKRLQNQMWIQPNGEISVDYGTQNAKKVINYLISNFPESGTPEATEMKIRSDAIRLAIFEKMTSLKQRGFNIKSCAHPDSYCSFDGINNISYFHQENLLKGLIHLEIRLEEKKEKRLSINIISYSARDDDQLESMPSWYNFKLKTRINKRFIQTISSYSDKIKAR